MNIAQAKAQAVSENPFYGKKALLTLLKYYEKVVDENTNAAELNRLLNAAWTEVAEEQNSQFKELFFMIIFAGGDIANREHNMFANIKVDQGGQAKRKAFRLSLAWILDNQREYFYKFLPLIAEYTNYENLFYNQIRTDRRKGTLLSKESLDIDRQRVAHYLVEKLNNEHTTDLERTLIAKFLPKVPKSKRWRKDKEGKSVVRNKKAHTLAKDAKNLQFISTFNNVAGWETIDYGKNVRFKGYEQFRSKFLASTEAHLFSSKKILDFDTTQFLVWLESLPAGARFRVQCRLVEKAGTGFKSRGKWISKGGSDLGVAYLQWLADKETAMKKLVSLTDEEKAKMDKGELKTLTKQASITTGGNTIWDAFVDLYKSSNGSINANKVDSQTNVLLQKLVDQVKLDVPIMVCTDISGSMSGRISASGNTTVDRLDLAKLMTAIALYKNPNDELGNTFMTFESRAKVYSDNLKVQVTTPGSNRFMQSSTSNTTLPVLCDKKKPFVETLARISGMFHATGGTNFSSVADELKRWVDQDPDDSNRRIEIIQSYPVWLMISDGDLNSAGTPGGSMDQFKNKMLNWFGASPVIVVWDILDDRYVRNVNYFENIDNVVHLAGVNPGIINQVFCNLSDLDVIDIYTQLNSLHKSSRYEPVKIAVTTPKLMSELYEPAI